MVGESWRKMPGNFSHRTHAAVPRGRLVSSEDWFVRWLSLLCDDWMRERLFGRLWHTVLLLCALYF